MPVRRPTWMRGRYSDRLATRLRTFPRPIGTSPMDGRCGPRLVDAALAQARNLAGVEPDRFSFDFTALEDPATAAQRCHDKFGFRPISFSVSAVAAARSSARSRLLSSVVPGRPYTFENEADYNDEYAGSLLALTHKKAGWDCFRHVEILAQGAVPLMPDIGDVPEFTMVHYPKPFLEATWREFTMRGSVPDGATIGALAAHTRRHLTSTAMVQYLIRDTPLPGGRLLYLDESLPALPDYLSIMTLIGLSRSPGLSVDVLWPAHYLYSDWTGDPRRLYGLGFGYSRRIDATMRSLAKVPPSSSPTGLPDIDEYDAVIVGGVSRNRALATMVSAASTASRRYYLHGEDQPPDRSERKWLRNLVGESYVREIY